MSSSTFPTSTPVLIVGAGPIGMYTALQLAACGTKCVIVERNDDTSKHPKMEYSNQRSMELVANLSRGLPADESLLEALRRIGVPGHFPFLTIYGTSFLDNGRIITSDDISPPDAFTAEAKLHNDGSKHSQTFLRCSQILVEAELKRYVFMYPKLISAHWSTKFESLQEDDEGVMSVLTDEKTGAQHQIRSQYVVGCDGGGSRVRKFTGRNVDGEGFLPIQMYLVHFRSHDFTLLHRHGRFWHFSTPSNVFVSQNEDDIWTLHQGFPPDTDISKIDPVELLYKAVGGGERKEFKIDEILVTGKWNPANFLTEDFRSVGGRVFLAGDSAHQRIPAGGYGFNTGVGDATNIGWKLAAVINGTGGPDLLSSYNIERRPVSVRNSKRALEHWAIQITWWNWIKPGSDILSRDDEEGKEMRQRIHNHLQANKQIHRDYGIETDYRYTDSPVIIGDHEVQEPAYYNDRVTPTTWPGARAPHVYLKDGKTSIHDFFGVGPEFALFDFTDDGRYVSKFRPAAESLKMPLKCVSINGEDYARQIYERDAVLIRPDSHVAWRSESHGNDSVNVEKILRTVMGHASC